MNISKSKITLFSSLSAKKMRDRHRMFVAEGEKCVSDTLGAFPLECVVATAEWIARHREFHDVCPGDILTATKQDLRKISSLSTAPEVIAVFRMPDADPQLPDVSGKLSLLLDGVQDPGNMGTIIRTADWFGVDYVFASRDCVDIFNPKTIQSTMGSLKRVRVIYTDLVSLIESNPGIPVYGLQLDGGNIYDATLGDVGFIAMGNEGNGLSDRIKSLVTHRLLIPPFREDAHGESLNVAIATAITLALFRKKH